MTTFLGLPEFLFSLVGKFSAGVALFSAVLLALPESTATEMSLSEFRAANKTQLWLALLLSASMFASYVGKLVWSFAMEICKGILKENRQERAKQDFVQLISKRLKSLDQREMLWLQYCLYNNYQTIACAYTDRTANSLQGKGILVRGSGSALNLPYTIRDEVWDYLTENRDILIPKMDRHELSTFEHALTQFKDSFRLF